MKVVFFGEGPIASGALPLLHESFGIHYIFTTEASALQTRKRANMPVTCFAQNNGICLTSTKSVTPAIIRQLEEIRPDIIIVVSFGLFLPQSLLSKARLMCINLHPSNLPKYRGAAPIPRALENGDEQVGICVIEVTKKMDAGDIFARSSIPINDDIYSSDLYQSVGEIGGKMLCDVCVAIEHGSFTREKQDDLQCTMANKVGKEELLLNFNQDARVVLNKVRAFDVFGGCYFNDSKYGPVKIWRAEFVNISHQYNPGYINSGLVYCGTNALKPLILQRAGRAKITAEEFWNGYKP